METRSSSFHSKYFYTRFISGVINFRYGKTPFSHFATHYLNPEIGDKNVSSLVGAYTRSTVTRESIDNEVQRYELLSPKNFDFDENLLDKVVDRVDELLTLPTKSRIHHLNDFKFDEDFRSTLPLANSPGLPWTMRGVKTKREAIELGLQDLRFKVHLYKTGKIKRLEIPPSQVSTRNHLVVTGVQKVRGVYPCPLDIWILEAMMFKELLDLYNNADTIYALGIGPLTGGHNRLAGKLTGYYKALVDFSAFDKTVPAIILHHAFWIIRRKIDITQYAHWGVPFSYQMEKILDVIEDYFINTPFQTPEGRYYSKDHGIPSGSLLTNVIGSVVNAIVCFYVCEKLDFDYVPELCRFMGDDGLLVFRSNSKFSEFDKFSDCLYSSFGMITNAEKFKLSKSVEDFTFLGYEVTSPVVYPQRNIIELFRSMIHPEHKDKKITDFYQRLIGLSYAGIGDKPFLDICRNIEKKMFEDYGDELNTFEYHKSIKRFIKKVGLDDDPKRVATADDFARFQMQYGYSASFNRVCPYHFQYMEMDSQQLDEIKMNDVNE